MDSMDISFGIFKTRARWDRKNKWKNYSLEKNFYTRVSQIVSPDVDFSSSVEITKRFRSHDLCFDRKDVRSCKFAVTLCMHLLHRISQALKKLFFNLFYKSGLLIQELPEYSRRLQWSLVRSSWARSMGTSRSSQGRMCPAREGARFLLTPIPFTCRHMFFLSSPFPTV